MVVDDFVAVGFGNTHKEAVEVNDHNLEAFRQRCKDWDIRLNLEKLFLRTTEAQFIVHTATAKGLRVDPDKVQAISEMTPPADVAAVQRMLWLTQYLSKFLPHLSDLTKPLRELTQKDVSWAWDHAQQEALDSLKKRLWQVHWYFAITT